MLQSLDASRRECFGGEFQYGDDDSYQIVQCQGCDALSFRKAHTNSEDCDYDPETGEQSYDVKVDIYPSRIAGWQKLRHTESLPYEVKRIYEETHAALCNKQPIPVGIGIRALVKAVCAQKQAPGKTLELKIDNLVLLGY